MLPLNSKDLTKDLKEYLEKLQQQVDSKPSFEEKVKFAKEVWERERPLASFKNIQKVLIEMCVGRQLCNYCETSKAVPIEHIFPKKIFPEKAFVWENYLCVCDDCNRTKSDKFHIFNPAGSENDENARPPRGTYEESASKDAVLINPREEDPMNFMEVDLCAFTFLLQAISVDGKSKRRADYTIETLNLNDEKLRAERQAATEDYLALLKRYVKAKASQSFEELFHAIGDFPAINDSLSFLDEKERIMKALEHGIKTKQHPTVWRELQRQSQDIRRKNYFKTTVALFQQAPEALLW